MRAAPRANPPSPARGGASTRYPRGALPRGATRQAAGPGLSADFSRPHINTLRATVLNQGTATASGCVVRFLDDGTPVGESAPLVLAAGQSGVATYAWTANQVRGTHTITGVVDPYNAIRESKENNNQLSGTLNLR